MRKFKKGGRRGTSRKKMMRKIQSSAQRQVENEFIAKCFMTVPAPSDEKAQDGFVSVNLNTLEQTLFKTY